MKFNRPIVFFDIESTGLDVNQDRIVEICVIKVFPDRTREVKTRRINPTIEISEGASEVHGITNEDVKDCPTFDKVAKSLYGYIQGCDIAGFNSNNFDCPMLYNEFYRAGISWDYTEVNFIDVGNLFKIQEPRTLTAAYKFYCDKDLEDAHSAEADVQATIDVFFAQLERYDDLPKSVEAMDLHTNYGNVRMDLSGKFYRDEDDVIRLSFGKYRGEPAKDHLDFVEWMLYRANFSPDTNLICNMLLQNQL